jgi:hypothetical protein
MRKISDDSAREGAVGVERWVRDWVLDPDRLSRRVEAGDDLSDPDLLQQHMADHAALGDPARMAGWELAPVTDRLRRARRVILPGILAFVATIGAAVALAPQTATGLLEPHTSTPIAHRPTNTTVGQVIQLKPVPAGMMRYSSGNGRPVLVPSASPAARRYVENVMAGPDTPPTSLPSPGAFVPPAHTDPTGPAGSSGPDPGTPAPSPLDDGRDPGRDRGRGLDGDPPDPTTTLPPDPAIDLDPLPLPAS